MSKENIVLTIINDGDGSECGLSYKQRLLLAQHPSYGLGEYRAAARRVALKYGGTRRDIFDAATEVLYYYMNHLIENRSFRNSEFSTTEIQGEATP